MKRIMIVILLLTACLTGCTESMVKLASESDLKSYAQEHYGSAEFLRTEESESARTCYFKDREFGFEYYVASYKSSVGMDGSTFWYQESKRSDFESKYYSAVWSSVELTDVPENITYEKEQYIDSNVSVLGYVTISDKFQTDAGMVVLKALSQQLMELDSRKLLSEHMIVLRDEANNWIGRFDFTERKYITEVQANRSFYLRRAQEIMRIEDIELDDSELMYQKDVPGLSGEQIVEILGTDNSVVTCYYFHTGNKKYFIADICVMYNNGPHQYIYNVTDGCSMVSQLNPYG